MFILFLHMPLFTWPLGMLICNSRQIVLFSLYLGPVESSPSVQLQQSLHANLLSGMGIVSGFLACQRNVQQDADPSGLL